MARGQLYTVSAPSGAGKTSLINALLQKIDNLQVSVSHTTRAMREGEQDGRDYFFVNENKFLSLLSEGQFLEHARVFDNYYGTTRQATGHNLDQGVDVLLEIDWQGAQQIHTLLPDSRGIFILPPSREVLVERLRGRGRDSDEEIARRTLDAVTEMRHCREADYIIINDDFSRALAGLAAIITSARLERGAQLARNTDVLHSLLSAR